MISHFGDPAGDPGTADSDIRPLTATAGGSADDRYEVYRKAGFPDTR